MSIFTVVILTLLVYFIALTIWRRYQKFQLRDKLGLPGPKPNFFLGNLSNVIKWAKERGLENTPYMRLEWNEKYGKTFGFYIGNDLEITTTDLDFAKEVFIKQFSNFVDRPVFSFNDTFPFKESLLQVGKYGSYGYGWKEIRSIVSPVFTTGKMKLMFGIVHERIETLKSVLSEKIEVDNCLDVYDEFQALTLDVIGRCAFGTDANSLNDRNDPFYINCREFFLEIGLEKSIPMLLSFVIPFMGPYLRKISKVGRVESVLIDGLRKIVEERKKQVDTYPKFDLIQLILQQDKIRQETENKPPMHSDTIISNCYAFLLAGYETTSTALAYAAWLLAKHQDVQKKLYAEIVEQLGEEQADYDTVMKLPYLDAFFHECLRLMPPVAFFASRKCIKETVVNGYTIPEGVVINVPVHAVHWDAEYCQDPFKFDPERFTDKKYFDPLTWIPFGIGPRNCVGMRFAEAEFKATIVEISRSFRFEMNEKSQDPLKCKISGPLMRPIDGVVLKVVSR